MEDDELILNDNDNDIENVLTQTADIQDFSRDALNMATRFPYLQNKIKIPLYNHLLSHM